MKLRFLNHRFSRWAFILIVIAIAQIIMYRVTQAPKLRDLGPVPEALIKILQPSEDLYAINFFASWCGACRQEHSLLLYLNKELKLPIYGIASSEEESSLERFIKEEGNPYIKLIINCPNEVLKLLNVEKIPRTLLVKNGRIIYDQHGPFNKFIIQQDIIPLLSQAQNY